LKEQNSSLRILIFTCVVLIAKAGFAQKLILPNETPIFSCEIQSGKTIILVKDSANKYIVYRFGTKNKIEFEYPEKTTASWTKLMYSFYLRGGGTSNEGMDLNYVYFTNNNYQYIIYDTYFSADNKTDTGIKIIDLTTKKTTNIKGKLKTRKGSLINFRDNGLLKVTEEIFE
jgi:hypothetical protein